MSCAPRSEIISSYICMYDLGASNRSVVGHVVPVAGHTCDNTVFVSSTRMHAVKKVVNGAMMGPGEGCWKPTISTSFIAPHGLSGSANDAGQLQPIHTNIEVHTYIRSPYPAIRARFFGGWVQHDSKTTENRPVCRKFNP